MTDTITLPRETLEKAAAALLSGRHDHMNAARDALNAVLDNPQPVKQYLLGKEWVDASPQQVHQITERGDAHHLRDKPEPQPVKQALPYPTDAQLAQYLRDNACGGSNYNRVLNHAADVLEGVKP